MSRAQISKHYTRLLQKWPQDLLRPEISFQALLLRPRISAAPLAQPPINTAQPQAELPSSSPATTTTTAAAAAATTATTITPPTNELRELNAMYALLENRFGSQFPTSSRIMAPASNPDHYRNLARELEELPTRSRFGHMLKRLGNMVRWQ